MTKEPQQSSAKIGIIFIHGAGLAGWIWDDVAKNISLPHVCADFASLERINNHATLADYVAIAYQQAEQLNTEQIVIVAHSLGGVIGVELGKKLDSRLARFVAICASIPKPGNNFVSTLPFPQKLVIPAVIRLAGTKPHEAAIRSGLGSGLSTKQSDKVVANFQQESAHLYTDRISKSPAPNMPSTYLRTTKDREFSVAVQDKSAANLSNPQVIDIDSGHLPMLSDPAEVSKQINEALKTAIH